jgi:hypothetical protein
VNIFYEDECVLESQDVLMFHVMQTYAFGDGVATLTSNFDTLRIRACKLPTVQGQPNEELKKKDENECWIHFYCKGYQGFINLFEGIEKLKMR